MGEEAGEKQERGQEQGVAATTCADVLASQNTTKSVLDVLSDHDDLIRTYNLDLDKLGHDQAKVPPSRAPPSRKLLVGETKSALEVLSEHDDLIRAFGDMSVPEDTKAGAFAMDVLVPPPLSPPRRSGANPSVGSSGS